MGYFKCITLNMIRYGNIENLISIMKLILHTLRMWKFDKGGY